jgi:adenine-specific DNA-methyltransferase
MPQEPTYGPQNRSADGSAEVTERAHGGSPHPLSQLRTERIWEGKDDEYGDRREVDIAGCAMPVQRLESIDKPRRAAAATGHWSLFEQQKRQQDDFRNRLFACAAQPFWGDNKLVIAALLQEFKGKVDLIYIDPTFDVGTDFSMSVAIGEWVYDR